MQEESPEGGRFKKEVQIDNQSYLLLIRDEGGSPELQVWVINFIHQLRHTKKPFLKIKYIQGRFLIRILLEGFIEKVTEIFMKNDKKKF